MRNFWVVLSYSFTERFRSRVYLITTLVGILCIALIVFAPTIYQKFHHQNKQTIEVVNATGYEGYSTVNFSKYISGNYNWKLVTESEINSEKKQVKEGKITGLIVIDKGTHQIPDVHIYTGTQSLNISQQLQQFVQSAYTTQEIQSLNLTAPQMQALTGTVNVETTQLSSDPGINTQERFVPVMIMLLLLYMSILLYGSSVSTSIATEKSSRVMELLITSVRPIHLMFGKVVGVVLVGLVQYIIFIASFVICHKLSPGATHSLDGLPINFSTIPVSVFVLLFVFFILGYFFYATLYAALGSLVSRSEDVTQSMMPLTLLMVVAFVGAMYSEQSPTNHIITVGSFIPFFTPMFMFVRIGLTTVPTVQIVISILDLVAAIVLFGWLAAKIYRIGVLLYGKNPSYRQVWLALRSIER